MAGYNAGRMLDELEQAISADPPERPAAMPGDAWLLRSALQKAIRRNEPERATQAAAALWRADRRVFWNRLLVTCLEDVGAGNIDAVIQTLTAISATSWRRRVGDERVALYLARMLAGTVKNRMGDELFTQAERDPGYNDLRERLAKADDDLLAGYAAHENSPLIERALSLWYLCGMKKFPSDRMPGRNGSPEKAAQVLRNLDVPAALAQACVSVMGRTSCPLPIFMPLIWQEVRKQHRPLYVFYDPIPVAPDVDGLPVYAADMFTRVGLSCLREVQKSVPVLREFAVKQVALALFYIEGCRVDKVLTSEALEDFRRQGEIIDAESAGLMLAEYIGIKDCLTANLPLLDDIRQRQLRRHLEGEE